MTDLAFDSLLEDLDQEVAEVIALSNDNIQQFIQPFLLLATLNGRRRKGIKQGRRLEK